VRCKVHILNRLGVALECDRRTDTLIPVLSHFLFFTRTFFSSLPFRPFLPFGLLLFTQFLRSRAQNSASVWGALWAAGPSGFRSPNSLWCSPNLHILYVRFNCRWFLTKKWCYWGFFSRERWKCWTGQCRTKNAGVGNAEPENAGLTMQDWKRQDLEYFHIYACVIDTSSSVLVR